MLSYIHLLALYLHVAATRSHIRYNAGDEATYWRITFQEQLPGSYYLFLSQPFGMFVFYFSPLCV